MENYSYSSYADSHDSSPRSRDNESWDDQQPPPPSSNYKVKFMCSYGGKIQPRPHDNQLTYVGGETKILSVDRNVKFSSIVSKLSSFVCEHNNDICFKYQLPGEDLDALISVTNDEDLDHMMLEYDRLHRSAGSRPARLRIFLFPVSSSNPNSNQSSLSFSGDADSSKPTQQWFVDALNSVPIQSLDASPHSNVSSADFLFGSEQHHHHQQVSTPTKSMDPRSDFETKISTGSNSDRNTGEDSLYEMQRQLHELQRLQISNQEQQQQQQAQAAMFQRKNEANNLNLPRQYQGEYYVTAEKQALVNPYWQQDRIAGTERQQQQVYMIPPTTAMFQTPGAGIRPVAASQGYYGMQRVVPEVYREQTVYTMAQPQPQPQPQPQKMMMGEAGGYTTTQVTFDSNGRQLFYTTGTTGVPSSYRTAVTTVSADPRQSAGQLNQEGKPLKPPQL